MAEAEYLTVEQVGTKLQMHPRTVRRLLSVGSIPGRKIGGKEWRVSAAALRAYIEGGDPAPSPASPAAPVEATSRYGHKKPRPTKTASGKAPVKKPKGQ